MEEGIQNPAKRIMRGGEMTWNGMTCVSVTEKKRKKVLPKWILEVKKINNPPLKKLTVKRPKKLKKIQKKRKKT